MKKKRSLTQKYDCALLYTPKPLAIAVCSPTPFAGYDASFRNIASRVLTAPLSELNRDLGRLRERMEKEEKDQAFSPSCEDKLASYSCRLPELRHDQKALYLEKLMILVMEKINSLLSAAVLDDRKDLVLDVGVFLFEDIKNNIINDLTNAGYTVERQDWKVSISGWSQ